MPKPEPKNERGTYLKEEILINWPPKLVLQVYLRKNCSIEGKEKGGRVFEGEVECFSRVRPKNAPEAKKKRHHLVLLELLLSVAVLAITGGVGALLIVVMRAVLLVIVVVLLVVVVIVAVLLLVVGLGRGLLVIVVVGLGRSSGGSRLLVVVLVGLLVLLMLRLLILLLLGRGGGGGRGSRRGLLVLFRLLLLLLDGDDGGLLFRRLLFLLFSLSNSLRERDDEEREVSVGGGRSVAAGSVLNETRHDAGHQDDELSGIELLREVSSLAKGAGDFSIKIVGEASVEHLLIEFLSIIELGLELLEGGHLRLDELTINSVEREDGLIFPRQVMLTLVAEFSLIDIRRLQNEVLGDDVSISVKEREDGTESARQGNAIIFFIFLVFLIFFIIRANDSALALLANHLGQENVLIVLLILLIIRGEFSDGGSLLLILGDGHILDHSGIIRVRVALVKVHIVLHHHSIVVIRSAVRLDNVVKDETGLEQGHVRSNVFVFLVVRFVRFGLDLINVFAVLLVGGFNDTSILLGEHGKHLLHVLRLFSGHTQVAGQEQHASLHNIVQMLHALEQGHHLLVLVGLQRLHGSHIQGLLKR